MVYNIITDQKITFEALCKLANESDNPIAVYVPQLDENGLEVKSNNPFGIGQWLEFDSGHSPDEILRTLQSGLDDTSTPAEKIVIYSTTQN